MTPHPPLVRGLSYTYTIIDKRNLWGYKCCHGVIDLETIGVSFLILWHMAFHCSIVLTHSVHNCLYSDSPVSLVPQPFQECSWPNCCLTAKKWLPSRVFTPTSLFPTKRLVNTLFPTVIRQSRRSCRGRVTNQTRLPSFVPYDQLFRRPGYCRLGESVSLVNSDL